MTQVLQERYQVVKELGRGGNGKVFLCSDLRLSGSFWSIKELNASGLDRAVFEREAVMLSNLKHPRIPLVADFFIQGDYGYLVCEYLDGLNLHDLVEQNGPIIESQAMQWGMQLAEVLLYLHQRNPPLYHRDLKPQNVIVTADGIRLIDFGLACEDQGQLRDDGAGSLSFTAPEQMQANHRLGPGADIYSLGAVLYYILKGVPPGPIGAEKHRIISQRPGLSSETEELIVQCLQADPEQRPLDIQQVLSALQYQVAALPAPPPWKLPKLLEKTPLDLLQLPQPNNRWRLVLAFMPLLLVLMLAATLVISGAKPEHRVPAATPVAVEELGVSWAKIKSYMATNNWDQAEGALRVTLSSDPRAGWARLALIQLPMRRAHAPRVPLLLPIEGQEAEHVNWIVQGVALGQVQEQRFIFDLLDTHRVSLLEAWQKIGSVNMVLGPFGSQDALRLAPLAGNVPVLPIGATDPRVSQAATTMFPLGFPHWERISILIEHAVRTRGASGLVLFSTDVKALSTSARYAEESIRKATGKEVAKIGFSPEDSKQEMVARVAALNPDWIYLSDNSHQRSAKLIATLRQGGVDVPVICVYHPASESFVHELKGLSGQVWLVEPLWQSINQEFVSSWQKTFGLPTVDWNSALGYDAARLASLHWRAKGPGQVMRDLSAARPYKGLLGEYDLAHKQFKPFAFHYRLIEVENGQRLPGIEL